MLVRARGGALAACQATPRRFSSGRHVRGRDGVRIAYQVTEAPSRGAPVVLIARSLGGSTHAWCPLLDYLGDRYQFVTWDYRGLFGSTAPSSGAREAFTIERHVDDLESVLAAAGVTPSALVGSGMGGHLCLEACVRRPDLARALVLLNAASGSPPALLSGGLLSARLALATTALSDLLAVPTAALMRRAVARPSSVAWMKRLGMIAETADDEALASTVAAFGELDAVALVENLRTLRGHDVAPLLARVEAPTLVIAGDRDRLARRGLAQQMARRFARAETVVVRGGARSVETEFPELVALRIERFLGEHLQAR